MKSLRDCARPGQNAPFAALLLERLVPSSVPTAAPGHSFLPSTWLWSARPPSPPKWSRSPCCPIPFRQTLGNFAIFILLTSLGLSPVKISSVLPIQRAEANIPRLGMELLGLAGCPWAWERGSAPRPQEQGAERPSGSFFAFGFISQKTQDQHLPDFSQFLPKCQKPVTIAEELISL